MTDLFGNTEKIFPAKEIKTPDFSSFVAFDIETTGLSKKAEIIEIGAVKVINGTIADSFSEFVNPDVLISPQITAITGIDDDMVKDAGKIYEILPMFCEFAGNNILVGHNALSFDCRIMRYWAEEYGIYIGNDVFDTLRFVRYRCEPFPGMKSHNLSYLCDYFGIEPKRYHRAAADAEAAAELYFMLQKYGRTKEPQNKSRSKD